MIKVIISLIITCILNFVDYWQTVYAIQLYGLGVELNPIARFLLSGDYGWIAKLIVVPTMLTVMGITIRAERRMSWAAYVSLIYYICIVINNFVVLSRLQGI